MEEEHPSPSQINSIVYLNKKRKLQAELLGLPLPKHKCSDRNLSSECESPYIENPIVEDFDTHLIKGKTVIQPRDDESEMESEKDSNSFGGDSDSATSAPAEAKIQSEYLNTCPSDRPSTSSVNWGSSNFKNSLYSLDSRLVKKSSFEKVQSTYIGGDHGFPHNDFGLHSCLNFDEHLLEFGSHVDYSCLEHGNDDIELCVDKEVDDMLYSNETPPNCYVLSSGRWSVNQETQPAANKLTIDKEFEQYFSMLML